MEKNLIYQTLERFYWCIIFISLLFVALTVVFYQDVFSDLKMLAFCAMMDVLLSIIVYLMYCDIDAIHRERQYIRYWLSLESHQSDLPYLLQEKERLQMKLRNRIGRKLNSLKLDLVNELIGNINNTSLKHSKFI